MSKTGYRSGNAKRRQAVAAKLKVEAAARTAEQQLARLDAGGWVARRERAKLERKIQSGRVE